jgi:hypothetical protein
MCGTRLAAAVILLSVSGPCAALRAGEPSAPPPDDCQRYEADWGVTEQRAWNALCTQGEAVLATVAPGSGLAERSPAERQALVLKPSFVVSMLTRSPYRERLRNRGLRIRGAIFTEPLMLRDLQIDPPVFLLDCEFNGAVDLRRSQFLHSVSLVGSVLADGIYARAAQVRGSLLLGGSEAAGPALTSPPPAVAIKSISVRGAQIGGDLGIVDAILSRDIDLVRVRTGGSVNMFRLQAREILLAAAEVQGQLIIVDSVLRPDVEVVAEQRALYALLNLNFVRAAQDVFLNRSQVLGPTELQGAKIAGDLLLLGTSLGRMDARGAEIKGALKAGYNVRPTGFTGQNTQWATGAVLDLGGATLGSIATQLSLDYWPSQIVLRDFKTSAFDFTLPAPAGQRTETRAEWFTKWLNLQPHFAPQPYAHVRTLLADIGDYATAAAVGRSGRDRELVEAFRTGNIIYGSYLVASKVLIGYGYWMWLPIVWTVGFVLAGALIFRRSPESKEYAMPYGLSYSFDMFLPLVQLDRRHAEVDLKSGIRYYFYVHRIAGWVIGTFILAALAGFTK